MFRRNNISVTMLVLLSVFSIHSLLLCGTAQATLIGYWNFDSNVNDSSGNANHGVINGSVPYAAGKFGGANGATSYNNVLTNYVQVPNSGSLSGAWTGYTVSVWVNTASIVGVPIAKWTGGAGGTGFGVFPNGDWFTGNGSWIQASAGAYGNSTWNNLALRWDGANVKSYLNGAQVATTAMGAFSNNSEVMRFGRDNRPDTNSYSGLVDDAAIFSNALTVAETMSIYNVGNSTLAYSMDDMNKLFTLYGNATGTTITSDGKTWEYTASAATGAAGALAGSPGSYSVRFSDSISAGVIQQAEAVPEPSTYALALIGLAGLSCVALRKKYRRA